jgi:hypothetical protein
MLYSQVLKMANKGKNRRKQVDFEGFVFDSVEEVFFYLWLKEASEYGFVNNFEYQPKSFILSGPVYETRGVKSFHQVQIMRGHEYTADFKIELTDKWFAFMKTNDIRVFNRFFGKEKNGHIFYVDVKGVFNRFGGDRGFSINQKWVFQKYGVYVWKIAPPELFEKTWLPEKCRFTLKTNKESKRFDGCLTMSRKYPEWDHRMALKDSNNVMLDESVSDGNHNLKTIEEISLEHQEDSSGDLVTEVIPDGFKALS